METNRRNRLDLNTSAELAIFNAMQEVEKAGADIRLTEAVTLLAKAKDCVANFVDKIDSEEEKEYLDECIEKATPNLSKIKDVDKELAEIRGEPSPVESSDAKIKRYSWNQYGLEPDVNGRYILYSEYAQSQRVEREVSDEQKLKILEEVKFGFDICSDTSSFCLGYRDLVKQIETMRNELKSK